MDDHRPVGDATGLLPAQGDPVPGVAEAPLAPRDGLTLRNLLWLGFGSVFALWLISAYAVAASLSSTDKRAATLRDRFLRNEELLSTVRAQTLTSAIFVRDALLDLDSSHDRVYRDELQHIQDSVDQAMRDYVPHAKVEQAELVQLRAELLDYWRAIAPVVTSATPTGPAASAAYLRDQVIPRRETVIRISSQVHAFNESAYETERTELAGIRASLLNRIWLTSFVTVGLGVVIAVFAARAADRLDGRIRYQHQLEVQQARELARLSTRLLGAQEEERRRIARELHDEIGQALSALKLELAVAGRTAPMAAIDNALGEARAIADRTLATVRDLSQLLHPAMLDDLGLPDTADWYLRGFSRRTGIASELKVVQLDARLPREVELCSYRVIQEAVTNVARHAEARHCRVEIVRHDAALHLSIEDDGRGFDLGPARAADGRGLGLVGLRERIAGLGGRLQIESRRGAGTRLIVELPLSA
jgi:signal transduction histidine kinase